MSTLRVAIVGCGLIGAKRARALGPEEELVGCHDVDAEAARVLAARHGCRACATLGELLDLGAEVVIVATVHDRLAELAEQALAAGAHVLVEKPAGVSTAEIDRLLDRQQASGRLVKVGFNHRFHQGIADAVAEVHSGRHGELMHIRARYGHGGRPGYEREWRCDPGRSGGGELVDQGMHLLDLSNWLAGALPVHCAMLRTQFWDAPVEDNAALILGEPQPQPRTQRQPQPQPRTQRQPQPQPRTQPQPQPQPHPRTGPWALLHVSWTEWKNLFSIEIFCRAAKLQVDGLGRSYGAQRLAIHRMGPELGPPQTEEIVYPDEDGSWAREWEHFAAAIRTGDGRDLLGDLGAARDAWAQVEAAYAACPEMSPTPSAIDYSG